MLALAHALGAGSFAPAAAPAYAPTDLTTALVFWADGQDTATLFTDSGEATPSTNGSPVGRWKDKSGNLYHADQASVAARPTRDDAGINSHCALALDGGDTLVTPSIDLTGTAQIEIWVVARVSVDVSGTGLVVLGNLGSIGSVGVDISSSTWRAIALGNVGYTSAEAGAVTAAAVLLRGTIDLGLATNEASIEADASTTSGRSSNSANSGTFAANTLAIGSRAGSLYLTGAIGEVVVTNRALTAGEATSLRTYLRTRWGTP